MKIAVYSDLDSDSEVFYFYYIAVSAFSHIFIELCLFPLTIKSSSHCVSWQLKNFKILKESFGQPLLSLLHVCTAVA